MPRAAANASSAPALPAPFVQVPSIVGPVCGGSIGIATPFGSVGVQVCMLSMHQLPAVQSASTLQVPAARQVPLALHTPERQTVGPVAAVQGPSPLA